MSDNLSISVSDGTGVGEAITDEIVVEGNREILKQWVEQAFATELVVVMLNYISRVHPNADMGIARELVNEYLKDQASRRR